MATANHAFVVDKFGVIRVIDFEGGIARVADTCGDRDKPIICSCINDSQLVGIAKRDGSIEIKNPRNPHVNVSFNKALINLDANDSIAVMYLFNHSTRQSCKFLTCTTKGKLTLTTVDFQVDSTPTALDSYSWNLVEGFKGEISFGDVDDDETTCVFGGSDHLILCTLENHVTSILLPPKQRKNSPPSSLTCVSFFGGGRKIAAGTNNNEVHIYMKSHSIPNQRPDNVLRYDAYPIKAITDDPKAMLIHVGNGCGKVATIDTRRGIGIEKIVRRSYVVKSCDPPGSIRSIARHPKLDIIASCGWDRYLRIWDLNSDELLYEVNLGEHSSIVALFEAENPENDVEQVLEEENDVKQVPEEADDVDNSTSKKEKSKVVSALGTGAKAKNKKQKRKAEPEQVPGEEVDVDNTTNTKEKSKVVSGSAVGSEARVKKRKQKRKLEPEQVLEEENDVEQVPEEEDDVDNSTSKKEKSKVVSALGTGARAKKKKQKCKVEPKQVLEEEDDADNTTNKKEKSKVVSAIGSEGKKKQKKSNSR